MIIIFRNYVEHIIFAYYMLRSTKNTPIFRILRKCCNNYGNENKSLMSFKMSVFLCCMHMFAWRRNVFTYSCVCKWHQSIVNAFLYCFSPCLASRDLLTLRLAPSSGLPGQQAHRSTLLLLPLCPMSSSYRYPAFRSLFSRVLSIPTQALTLAQKVPASLIHLSCHRFYFK